MGNRLSDRYKLHEGASKGSRVLPRTAPYQGAAITAVHTQSQTPTAIRRAPLRTAFPDVLLVDPLSLRLLVRMPTRSRPKQALEVLGKYLAMAGCPITLEVVIDDDDASMQALDVRRQFESLGCTITSGKHASKIAAVNGGRVKDWDVLLLASDDMVPVAQDYAVRALTAMATHFPHLDGAVYFDDNYAGEKLCTLPIMGRRLYEQLGYVYYPEYRSFFCDNEQTEVLQATKKIVYVPERIIEHRHPAGNKMKVSWDALYAKNNAAWGHDEEIYKRRKQLRRPYAQAAFDSPPVWLSICIATIAPRKAMLDKLLPFLFSQAAKHPREVEVVIDGRDGVTIGAKRNAMIQRAVGRFVAHVDDDDWLSDDYLNRVLAALKKQPDADCASLMGEMTVDGKYSANFLDSIRYTKWSRAKNGLYERTPEHRNAVRRDLAVRVGFPDVSWGEDHEFSKRLRPLLRTEADTGSQPIYFYNYATNKPAGWYYGSERR